MKLWSWQFSMALAAVEELSVFIEIPNEAMVTHASTELLVY